jgi:hypothetical protein
MFIFFAHTKKTEPKESVPGSVSPAVGGIPSSACIFGGYRARKSERSANESKID